VKYDRISDSKLFALRDIGLRGVFRACAPVENTDLSRHIGPEEQVRVVVVEHRRFSASFRRGLLPARWCLGFGHARVWTLYELLARDDDPVDRQLPYGSYSFVGAIGQ
jgi:hypothetical protein